tara:strand:+ start:137 stop:586 length:450 start_codon:yes stop_codon:yes gene_type:complete
MSYKGKFKPKNRAKYKGDHTAITYRSLWELRFMRYLDTTPSVLKWSSEEIVIPYRSPIDGRRHRYFPDFWVKVKTSEGLVKESLIEVKPKAQCSPPKGAPPKDRRKRGRFIREVKTWGVNEAKWKAAKAYCDDRKWGWKILTEDDLTKY